MALCPGDTTEWDDIQRKMGNFAPRAREVPQRDLDKAVVEAVEKLEPLEHCSTEALDRLEDDVDEDVLAKYRRQRLAEMKAASRAAKFGDVRQVTRCNFVAEVTEGSSNGQWVLVLLYVEAKYECHHISRPWTEAARRFPAVKFMQGVASEVIPNFPDDSTPAVFIYRNTECHKQLMGMEEWGGANCTADTIEWVLAHLGVVETEMEEDPRLPAKTNWRRPERQRGGQHQSSSEDEDGEAEYKEQRDRCYASMQLDRRLNRYG
mmetsp:Transcript_47962/g.138829  ORF Transcript_47962/g.138829 Transcript_47962/m.138829 type:complete len:263 (+) Transcript_47962:60-848(+)